MIEIENLRSFLVKEDTMGYYNSKFFDLNNSLVNLRKFQMNCESENLVVSSASMLQDGGFFAKVFVEFPEPMEKTSNPTKPISVVFSSFGSMIAVEGGDYLSEDLWNLINDIATKSGFRLIPPHLLNETYMGVHNGFDTWYSRFFDYF